MDCLADEDTAAVARIAAAARLVIIGLRPPPGDIDLDRHKLTKLTGNSPKIGRGRPGPVLKHDAERHRMRLACLDKCRRRLQCPFNRFFHQNRLA